ncbi:branched-chain amino acid ABC transporter permease [Natronosporangium hydrolyticum]|uniref:Branched-chain amino acid ABC transporter permease n=1 Tax=Natronosporangium hydrolyticum TaxID=2811111 RepID=A0A895Y7L5_9ACTN|nr:branched-chain amino acid ABC transporter permease [Natronosporangium hydrolyticum]QSB13707.1 branched-chain amino acid ABC transporter permease [Natronosporangium hydrolyticum]
MLTRPLLHTSYRSDMSLLDSWTKRALLLGLLALGVATPLLLPDPDLRLLSTACVFAIGAIGLGLLTGSAGQVSLGHAFFLGVGCYTAAVVSGDPDDARLWGFGISEILIWLPAAGLVAAAVGVLIAPLATRLRGLYLAIVTLGLVFVGEHFFEQWRSVTGGARAGRAAAEPVLFGYPVGQDGAFFTEQQQIFWLMFGLLVVFALAARNLSRSSVGRAFNAIRDRDIAAGTIGVNLFKYKTIAFGVSSFYAGCAGALLYAITGHVNPTEFNLVLSVLFIAMVLVGGAGTVSGAIAGAFFITLLGRMTEGLGGWVPVISTQSNQTPNIFQLQNLLYGALIIGFLLYEPRGLFGIWLRIRNWWKSYPFSY